MISNTEFIKYLDILFENPKPELNYSNFYELLIAVVLSAQCTDKKVNKATEILFKKYPNFNALSSSKLEDIESIVKPLGLYKTKSKNIRIIASKVIENNINEFNMDRDLLEMMPGVGRKTASIILSTYGVSNELGVDTHILRVSYRLGITKTASNPLLTETSLKQFFGNQNYNKLHMQLILFGRYICKAIKPFCTECKIKDKCNYYNSLLLNK
ncbi:MAG: endonuclease III [Acholeplasmatales bacterium]|jgi:endonuclease-3|nr:endonuclease III [Acholeplasmatales bacterium]